MGPLRSWYPVEYVDLTGDSDDETRSLNTRYGDKGVNSIDKTTADVMIACPCVSPVHGMELASQEPGVSISASTEPASPVQQRVVREKSIRGRLEHVDTGGYVDSLHLVIFPPEDGHDLPRGVHDSLWGGPNDFPAAAALGGSTDLIPDIVRPAESHSNRDIPVPLTVSPSGLLLSTDPTAGSARPSVGRVALPPGDYSAPSECRATRLSLGVAGRALEVCALEIDRFGGCVSTAAEPGVCGRLLAGGMLALAGRVYDERARRCPLLWGFCAPCWWHGRHRSGRGGAGLWAARATELDGKEEEEGTETSVFDTAPWVISPQGNFDHSSIPGFLSWQMGVCLTLCMSTSLVFSLLWLRRCEAGASAATPCQPKSKAGEGETTLPNDKTFHTLISCPVLTVK
ncbi:conserved hypothetical protein [Coccidioides posadasii str. Silveira]|uniref:Uncharacterized protein n=1 Tax=Coccidioides posadasii (strain RMSCC 757 / Silveira) TaxID=443226 RepID=E9DFE5_COCPS|nr:conserved hypothetical protein [Coccidioides posadasii str. Silveira]